ncbi:hypothetical protein KXV92_000936 [Aspergillus fumigatus]|nr:hypothetical protein KXX42_003390 [Aspergillus fumigatus]KAH1557254.1 hypothetical protein KXX57_007221 [Aspergillus fumigatus]KAH1984808.1 hypothetical protein KXW88_001471 [Aspergillus fumigatus]KAH2673845.1 hypothetical protein KXV32_007448 [Aspergillus fumigatus]KAH2766679.1 hypothetical protein KXV94_002919 [Aspergillus fumigatus]
MDASGYHDTSKSQQNTPVSLTSAANSGKSVAKPFTPGRGIQMLSLELRQFRHSPLLQDYHSGFGHLESGQIVTVVPSTEAPACAKDPRMFNLLSTLRGQRTMVPVPKRVLECAGHEAS